MTLDITLITGIRGQLKTDNKKPLVMVLGIRPDVIRASIMLRELRAKLGKNFILIWSGQHYSDNLKDIFFKELNVLPPDIELNLKGSNDAELVSDMILKLGSELEKINPEAVIFLGDTNTVTGSLAAAQLNIPVVHIEGCMRSYNWKMPEEKYRTMADHLSDLIYAYLDVYKNQGLSEGLPSENIVVTGNPIVDVLEEYFLSGKLRMKDLELEDLLQKKYKIFNENYYVMTCHRRENVEVKSNLINIMKLASATKIPVLFPAGYRTQKKLLEFNVSVPKNVRLVDPVGYLELLEIMNGSNGVLTDSGTVVEEVSILGIPSIQMRTSTERPQVYEFGASIKFDPSSDKIIDICLAKFAEIQKRKWTHNFGDGKASYRIVQDILDRYSAQKFFGHQPEKYSVHSQLSYMES